MPPSYRPLDKDENEGKLRRAALNGDTAAYHRLKEARRTNGADDKAYRQASAQPKQTPASSHGRTSAPSSSADTLSAKEERELRKRMHNGDAEAFNILSRAGRTNYFDRKRFKNAQVEKQIAQSSTTAPKQPASRQKPKEESWVTRIIEASPSRVPDGKRQWVADKAEHTVRDLTRRGVSRKTAEQVAQQYVEEHGWRRLPEAERKWIEKHGGGIGT